MNELREVPGSTLVAQAHFAAGALAEHGVTDLLWRTSDGVEVRLAPRETDLPGMLRGRVGELVCPTLGLVIRRDGGHLLWSGSTGCAMLFAHVPGS